MPFIFHLKMFFSLKKYEGTFTVSFKYFDDYWSKNLEELLNNKFKKGSNYLMHT